MEPLECQTFQSSLGKITICCSAKGLRAVSFGGAQREAAGFRNGKRAPAENGVPAADARAQAARHTRQAVRELQNYLSGRGRRFTVPLDLVGTPFQRKVWQALRRIPYGETRSYGEIARAVGNPRAARAVGMANHSNPVAIVVPCHRVIASDGSLGGYGGGLDKKVRLLKTEQASRV